MPYDQRTIDRFMKFVSPEPNTGCWLWLGTTTQSGYGQFSIDSVATYAHRFSYESFVGPIPDGLQLDHLCRVRCCCNPHHLEPVTGKVNTNRGVRHESTKTHCPKGHPYDVANTKRYKNNRQCRACANAFLRANWRKYRHGA